MKKLNKIIISEVADAWIVTAERGRHIKIKDRKYYGLSFCISGKITYIHNKRQFVSDCGNAILLPMGESYELYNNLSGEFPLINFWCEGNFTNEFISIPISNLEGYLKEFQRLKNNLLSEENRLKAISILYEIFHRLSLEDEDYSGILATAKKYIDKNIANSDLTNEKVAEYVNVSEVYLRRLFKEKYNITPKQYVLEVRIKMAKQLLSQGDKSITEISFLCGFSGVYHFCRTFKQKTAFTPRQYRTRYRIYGL